MKRSQIIAIGGAGFSVDSENLGLDRYILAQTGKEKPEVCFLPTASADSADYTMRFYAAFSRLSCRPSHLSLFNPPSADLRTYLMAKDLVYVGGGNTKNLLALWKAWDLDVILRDAWKNGTVLCGVSAGANCWFESCVTDSIPGALTALPALGFLPGSFCPHYDGEAARRPSYQRLIGEGRLPDGIAAEDAAAVHFVDGLLHAAVSSRANAKAFQVKREGDTVEEHPLPMRALA